jgi:HD-like signal output (HDOD) protein
MDEKLFQAAAKIRELPNLPAIPLAAQEILNALRNDTITIGQLVAVIEADPALMARIVSVANSAYFGARQKIYSVHDAITRVLGTNNVFSIALSVVLAGPFKANKCPGFHLELYWSEALKTAILAQSLAGHLRNRGPDMEKKAYLCGLLHNIGLLVLAHTFPDKIAQIFSIEASEPDRDISDVEDRLIGIDRRHAGAILARKWNLPDDLYAVIEHQHDPSYRGDHWQLTLVVGTCATWARALSRGKPCEIIPERVEPLQLGVDVAQRCVDRVRDKVAEIHKMALMLAMQ